MDDKTGALTFDDLVEFLQVIETHLAGPLVLVAAGGTALTLLRTKASTLDIDVTGRRPSIEAFEDALECEPHGFKVDRWPDGTVFDVTLPEDYLERSRPVATPLERIDLRALDPVDIVVTKVSRLDARDIEDTRAAVKVFHLEREVVAARAAEIERAGSGEGYEAKLAAALERCWGEV